jgi:hypothetical protein
MNVGDILRIYTPKLRRFRGEVTVKAIEGKTVTFDQPLPKGTRKGDHLLIGVSGTGIGLERVPYWRESTL